MRAARALSSHPQERSACRAERQRLRATARKWPGSSRRVRAASFPERSVQKVIIAALPGWQIAGSLSVAAATTVRVGPDRARPMEPVGALAAANFDQLAPSASHDLDP